MTNPHQNEDWLGLPPVITEKEITRTLEADIVVVGGGLAGVAAVRQAAELGASVILLEKCATIQARSGDFAVMDSRVADQWGTLTLNTFLPTALAERGFKSVAAGGYSSAVALGTLAGCLLGPMLSIRTSNTKTVLLCAAFGAFICAAFGWRLPPGVLFFIALFLAGLFCGMIMPVLMAVPVALFEIGARYARVAGGMLGTMQLLGAVVLPSKIIAPIAGENMGLVILLGGCCMLVALVFLMLIPRRVFK